MKTTIEPLRILVVEDSPANQKIAVRLLEKRGHHVYLASNGLEALAIFDRAPVDLVLMDVHMPEMDGVQATMELRKRIDAGRGWIPIVAVSAHDSREDQERCLAAGMDAFVSKPIDITRLVDLVERLARAGENQEEEPAATADFGALFEELGGDRQAFLDFTRLFWNDTASWLDRARTVANQDRLDEVAVAAGTLESLARSVHATGMAALAYEVRAKALKNDTIGAAAELAKLERYIMEVRSALARFCVALRESREHSASKLEARSSEPE
jgi:CheY-like chemotaxis protein